MKWDLKLNEIRRTNSVLINLQEGNLKTDLFKLIDEALQVDVDSEGNWEITDSSIRNAVDDVLTYYDVTKREDNEFGDVE